MKIKNLILIGGLFLILTFPVLAKDNSERPRRLEDKGPLTKITFIHYKKGHAKPPWAGGGKPKDKESACYKFIAKGFKWKDLPQDYIVDPNNKDGLSESFVMNAISAGANEWDNYASTDLFGVGLVGDVVWNSNVPNDTNELSFGNYPESGVIAVTNVWGYFYGPPPTREILEFDILFDTNYVWGNAAVDPSVMDLQNIATHELGHGVGMKDLYEASCAEETMYGYSDEGEIKKRDLNAGDIAGIKDLYK